MPHHSISPTPSHQGLGITYSTLSPTPLDAQSSSPPRLTGMGLGPRALSNRPSPTRGAQQLFQPTFSLRPTHTSNTSAKGFTSFSAIPPSPRGPRTPFQVVSTGSNSGTSGTEPFVQAKELQRHPSRSGSVASLATTNSRTPRRSKSSELLRRFSRSDTVAGGQYFPLSGDDEFSSTTAPPSTHSPTRHSSRSRNNTISTNGVTPSQSQPASLDPTPTSDSHVFAPGAFPSPPRRSIQDIALSVRGSELSRSTEHPIEPLGVSRSSSQPSRLQALPESDNEAERFPHIPHHNISNHVSDLAAGIHSKNAVLLSAESGGMMLAFSPSGDGVWREGQMIDGGSTGLFPSPEIDQFDKKSSLNDEVELQTRPWSNSTMSQHRRPGSLGHRGRSLSDGVMLARQGTLLHPSSSNKRASAELGIMLGSQRLLRPAPKKLLPPPELDGWHQSGGLDADRVHLEASKKRKARVEVDVVLERECVVEGGEIRGRMEVRVSGGRRGEGLRVGGGKVRVVGFEELSPTSRHIFYHHSHLLPLFSETSSQSGPCSSLFASDADSEGYRLAAEGVHNIPFRLRLPLGAGAKGSYSTPGGKGPSVRYVVVASVKIHVPATGKRSIAHFYRSIVVLPYMDPALVLMPSMEPIESYVSQGLGWNLGGERGKVEVRVALGRRIWVSGQRLWCEVGIRNDSSKKIKSLNLALLQTVQIFNPQPLLDATDSRTRSVGHRTSLQTLKAGEPGTPDADACQTSTQRRKVNEEALEADSTERYAGRVTGKGWWTGVEPGEKGQWDMSLLIPSGMLSIRRSRLIEVLYTLRVTINSSIYVDLPITLINFLSIDPPPMPGDAVLKPQPSIQHRVTAPARCVRPQASRMLSEESCNSSTNMAKASSTTLSLDALLQAGRIRAEAEGVGEEAREKARPLSMGSQYTIEKGNIQFEGPSAMLHVGTQPKVIPIRPKGGRMMSYLSNRSQSETSSIEADEQDKSFLAARRAQGRQLSLAAIGRAIDRAAAADAAEDDVITPGKESLDGEYFPAQTPMEEVYPMMGETSDEVDKLEQRTPRMQSNSFAHQDRGITEKREHDVIEERPEEEAAEIEQETPVQDAEVEAGNETILGDLVGVHTIEDMIEHSDALAGEYGGYDYADEIEDGDESFSTTGLVQEPPSLQQLPPSTEDSRRSLELSGATRQQYVAQSRSISGSFATDGESEEGHVYEAVKRNVSMRLPLRILPFNGSQEGRVGLSVLDGGSRRSSNAVIPAQVGSNSSHGATRRGSAPSIHPHALAMRRESSNPVVPSPLRPVEQSLQARSIQKKSSFPFTTSGSPLRAGESPVSPGKRPLYISPSVSPRSADPGTMMNPSTSLGDTPSNSQLRHQVSVSHSPGFESEEEGGPPELAPSVISDSASSEGQFLESPPIAIVPSSRSESTRALPKAPDPGGYIIKSTSETWTPPEHPLHTSINLVHNPNRAHAEPDPPPDSPGSSTHSVLPSVRSKIAQLETRDEALRKFSVSGASTQTPTPERPTATKRRSYTAALAPRPVRSASDDLDERERLGGTTFVNRKSYAEQQTMVYSPRDRDFGVAGGVLRRTGSANSTNTLTTVIGTAAHSDWNGRDLGSARSRMLGNSNVRGYTGVFNSDDRDDQRDYYALTDPREVMRRVSGVDEETDDSEGLL